MAIDEIYRCSGCGQFLKVFQQHLCVEANELAQMRKELEKWKAWAWKARNWVAEEWFDAKTHKYDEVISMLRSFPADGQGRGPGDKDG